MKIITKRTRVISMTQREYTDFLALLEKAANGQKVNYAEQRTQDGSYLGVSIEENDPIRDPWKASS